MTAIWEVREGDALERLRETPDESVQCCVTSPPYFGLRDYGVAGQIGLEGTPGEYVAKLVEVFREVRRVLRPDGTLWLVIGDSYAANISGGLGGSTLTKGGRQTPHNRVRSSSCYRGEAKHKDLLGIPWMVAFALRADGWWLRSDIILYKKNPMPESVTDRPTSAHEHMFLLSKRPTYFYDSDAIREPHEMMPQRRLQGRPLDGIPRPNGQPKQTWSTAAREDVGIDGNPAGRNKRNVWEVVSEPFPGAHFAVFGTKWIEPCILAGSSPKACGECGAPWERVVEIESRPNWVGNGDQKHDGTYYRENVGGGVGNDRRERRDLGWQPSCAHNDATGHSLVLDPFCGAGTTGLVALRHDRSFIGIELSPTYAEMARERIRQDAPLLNTPAEIAA